MTFYCTAYNFDDQVSQVFDSVAEAKNKVISHLMESCDMTKEAATEAAEAAEYDRDELGYGLVELEAENGDECFAAYI